MNRALYQSMLRHTRDVVDAMRSTLAAAQRGMNRQQRRDLKRVGKLALERTTVTSVGRDGGFLMTLADLYHRHPQRSRGRALSGVSGARW